MSKKSITTQGIILKRINYKETDRIITVLTQKKGKIACVAKGVRRIKSKKAGNLEPGNIAKIYLVKTKWLPLLTQANLIEDTLSFCNNLSSIRKLTQLLEIYDRLFVEEELDLELYQNILSIRKKILNQNTSYQQIKSDLSCLIEDLGFAKLDQTKYKSILEYISALSERPMRSFEYLRVC